MSGPHRRAPGTLGSPPTAGSAVAKPAVGSIALRWSNDATPQLVFGQIVEASEQHWTVHTAPGKLERWHRATVLRRLPDWTEAAKLSTAQLTAVQMATLMKDGGVPSHMVAAILSRALDAIAKGDWA